MNKVYLTFDIDWASDEAVVSIINSCLENQIKATFFATHESKTLEIIRKHPAQFEIGVHPNFLPGSTQGRTEEEIFDFFKKLVPDAQSIRTHCVYQHGKLYDAFNKHFGKKLVESSICMPGVEDIKPFELYTPHGCLIRVPFFWADDYYLLGKHIINPIELLNSNGCKVFMFHPVHIFHNTHSMEHYNAIKSGKASNKISKETAKGVENIFKELLEYINLKKTPTGLMRDFLYGL